MPINVMYIELWLYPQQEAIYVHNKQTPMNAQVINSPMMIPSNKSITLSILK